MSDEDEGLNAIDDLLQVKFEVSVDWGTCETTCFWCARFVFATLSIFLVLFVVVLQVSHVAWTWRLLHVFIWFEHAYSF